MAEEHMLKTCKQNFQSAKEVYFETKVKAERGYNKMKDIGAVRNATFWQWVPSNYPELQMRRAALEASNAQLLQIGARMYGPNVKEQLPDSEYNLISPGNMRDGLVGIQL